MNQKMRAVLDAEVREVMDEWAAHAQREGVAPSILIGMTIDGPRTGHPQVWANVLPDEMIPALLRRVADALERQAKAPTN